MPNDLIRFSRPVVSDAGHIAFRGTVVVPGQRRGGIFLAKAGGSIETIAAKNDPAPDFGTEPSGTFRHFYIPDMSSGGRVAFRAVVKRASLTKKLRNGVYIFASPSGAFLHMTSATLD